MCDSVSDDFREIQRLILQKYRPVEDDPRMTVSEKLPWIEEWWDKSELSLKGQRFHYEDIEKSISKANLKLRCGLLLTLIFLDNTCLIMVLKNIYYTILVFLLIA